MLSSFVSNLFWGSTKTTNLNEDEAAALKQNISEEEQGDWLVIDYSTTGENESIASETSWVVTPSPRFRRSSSTSSSLKGHSMENLLLECPPSLYQQQLNQNSNETAKAIVPYDKSKRQIAIRNQNRQLVLHKNRRRTELATQMGIPLRASKTPKIGTEPIPGPAVPKITKKSTRKHNENNMRVTRGKKIFKIHQCGVKAGRRRC